MHVPAACGRLENWKSLAGGMFMAPREAVLGLGGVSDRGVVVFILCR